MHEFNIAEVADRVAEGRDRILAEIRKVIVGQDAVIDQLLMALFTGGHCLITGVPGLAKTLIIKTVAQILDLSFKRIQFTPDLMPADITGTEVLDENDGHRSLRFVKGPVFAQIILADDHLADLAEDALAPERHSLGHRRDIGRRHCRNRGHPASVGQ